MIIRAFIYEVNDLPETLKRATESSATLLVMPFRSRGRDSAMVSFPGEYVAEIHAAAGN